MPVNPMPAAPAAAMITFFFVSLVARHRSLALPPRPNLLPFLGCFINTSLSLSLASSFPALRHKLNRIIKFAVVRGATFKLQETLVLSLVVAMVKLLEL
jgi:hypothetical protein